MRLVIGAAISLLALPVYSFSGSTRVGQDDKAVDQALKKFHDDFYKLGGKDDQKVAAVTTLGGTPHEKVVKVLGPLMTESSLAVRVVVVRTLSRFYGMDSATKELHSALRSSSNSRKGYAAVRIEILRALGALKVKDAAQDVDGMIDDRDSWVAKAAIDASGRIRVRSSIEPLIKALRRIEGPAGDGEISGIDPLRDLFREISPRLQANPPRMQSEREFLKDPILAALRLIARQSFTTGKEWESWWDKNKSTFKVAD